LPEKGDLRAKKAKKNKIKRKKADENLIHNRRIGLKTENKAKKERKILAKCQHHNFHTLHPILYTR
jgi:hypothetical protein